LERLKKKMKVSEEAHAQEAAIEAASEKISSRSLALHSSNELKDVVKVVFEKLKDLDFGIEGAAFIITQIENSKDVYIWICDEHAEYPSCFRTLFYETPVILDLSNAKESGTDFFSGTYSFEEKNPWFKSAFENTDYKTLPDELKKWISEQQFLTQTFAITINSAISIHFHHQKTLSENEIDILKRFYRLFEQTYTRFLDLQKAETQAMEAQIEAALESVRSRYMGMQKSEELRDAIQVVVEQLIKLNSEIHNSGFLMDFRESDDYDIWMADAMTKIPTRQHIPYFDHPFKRENLEHRDKGTELFTKTYSFDEKNSFIEAVWKYMPVITEEIKEVVRNAPALTVPPCFYEKYWTLSF
jgi:hypothetical protein